MQHLGILSVGMPLSILSRGRWRPAFQVSTQKFRIQCHLERHTGLIDVDRWAALRSAIDLGESEIVVVALDSGTPLTGRRSTVEASRVLLFVVSGVGSDDSTTQLNSLPLVWNRGHACASRGELSEGRIGGHPLRGGLSVHRQGLLRLNGTATRWGDTLTCPTSWVPDLVANGQPFTKG